MIANMDDSVDQYSASASEAGANHDSNLIAFPLARKVSQVRFDRKELATIFSLYGFGVASGEWRDYGIDFGREAAVFAIHRRSSEQPLYRITKNPALARKQGAYAVVAQSGLVLKRGPDLAQVLRVLTSRMTTATS
jgi:Protein of unknown function (DUF2794)